MKENKEPSKGAILNQLFETDNIDALVEKIKSEFIREPYYALGLIRKAMNLYARGNVINALHAHGCEPMATSDRILIVGSGIESLRVAELLSEREIAHTIVSPDNLPLHTKIEIKLPPLEVMPVACSPISGQANRRERRAKIRKFNK